MTDPTSHRAPGPGVGQTFDFDLHGVVGVRLLDATDRDLATIRRQLGPIEARLDREPDIVVRFVDRIHCGRLTYVAVGETAFDDDSFLILTGRGGAPGRTHLPFDRVARGIEITCERRLPAVPHLLAVINLTALAKGVLPLHASALTTGSTGVLVTGWSKGGKTEALLGCMRQGAAYVGDEWVYLTPDGRMLGLPEPIRLWAWQLDQLPGLLESRPGSERRRLATWRRLATLASSAGATRLPGSSLVRRARPALQRQTYLQIPPVDLFGADRVRLEGRLDAVVLVMSHDEPDTVTRPVTAGEVAARMQASLEEERAPLMAHYRQFRFAFPDRVNALIEDAAEQEAKLLATLLNDRPCVKVLHPHPCDIALLGAAVGAAVEVSP